jgi:hypothetical protein
MFTAIRTVFAGLARAGIRHERILPFNGITTRMTARQNPQHQPPEADVQFDINADDESFARMTQLFARHGDIYRVYAPGRKSHTYVINHPDDI